MRRLSLVGALVALAALVTTALATAAQAETYPSHPISLMVGFPPGGPTDTLARILAEAMGEILGQTVVIEETVTGAAGTIATGRVVHASPDGYTIGIGNWTSHVGSPAMYPLDYDILKDLQPVSLLTSSPLWIVAKNDLPPKTRARADHLVEGENRTRPHSGPSALAVAAYLVRPVLCARRSACSFSTCPIAAPRRRCRI